MSTFVSHSDHSPLRGENAILLDWISQLRAAGFMKKKEKGNNLYLHFFCIYKELNGWNNPYMNSAAIFFSR